VNASIRVDYNFATLLFHDQIIAELVAYGGDSGSLGLTTENAAVGLLFGGTGELTAFNKIGRVMTELAVDFGVPTVPAVPRRVFWPFISTPLSLGLTTLAFLS